MSPIDDAVLQRLYEDIGRDEAAMRELIATFIQQTPELLLAAGEAAKRGDARALLRAAHTLKSTAATFGANRLRDLTRALEADCASGLPADATPRAHALAREWDAVDAAIRGWRPA